MTAYHPHNKSSTISSSNTNPFPLASTLPFYSIHCPPASLSSLDSPLSQFHATPPFASLPSTILTTPYAQPISSSTDSSPSTSTSTSTSTAVPPLPIPPASDIYTLFRMSRPARISEYESRQHHAYRAPRPKSIDPVAEIPAPPKKLERLILTTPEEQEWLRTRSAPASLSGISGISGSGGSRTSRDSSSFWNVDKEKKWNGREPKPFDPLPPRVAHHDHKNKVISDFFHHGTGRFVSDDGVQYAQLYYRFYRPIGGRLRSHQESKTTPHGYHFDAYTKR